MTDVEVQGESVQQQGQPIVQGHDGQDLLLAAVGLGDKNRLPRLVLDLDHRHRAAVDLADDAAGTVVNTAGVSADGVAPFTATDTLTRANGAEVNLEDLAISILGGGVSASGLQVTDAKQPAQNQVAVETIAADASVYDLLLGKLVRHNTN